MSMFIYLNLKISIPIMVDIVICNKLESTDKESDTYSLTPPNLLMYIFLTNTDKPKFISYIHHMNISIS